MKGEGGKIVRNVGHELSEGGLGTFTLVFWIQFFVFLFFVGNERLRMWKKLF